MIIGTGILNWPAAERRSDRYGVVTLYIDTDSENSINLKKDFDGFLGILKAKVLSTRDSEHIGDLARGILPSTPNVGDIIELGRGHLFFTTNNGVGLYPEDNRSTDWLDPNQLYKVHSQTVELFFEPINTQEN